MDKEEMKKILRSSMQSFFAAWPDCCKGCYRSCDETCENYSEKKSCMSKFIDDEDKRMFANTKYKEMDFVRETSWDDYDKKNYASPVFKFSNGNRVVMTKEGKWQTL